MSPELQKKVDRAVKLIQSAGSDGQVVEVAYSGGKDSDVILELTRMSGINYRAIYKNTTIDPPGTIKHVIERGVEIVRPKKSFFQLIEIGGFPNRFMRSCCSYLKEYKVLDRCIMGVRKAESVKRAAQYSEPTECRYYGSKKEHVEAFYPILNWTDEDVVEFILEGGGKNSSSILQGRRHYRPEKAARLYVLSVGRTSSPHRLLQEISQDGQGLHTCRPAISRYASGRKDDRFLL